MTDITELAQSLKAAAIDAKELAIIARYSKGRAAAEKFYALANPNNVIALVEALEKAQQRIAELESRTVKLPKPRAHLIWIQAGHAPDDYWDDVAVSHSEKDRCCDGSERYPVYARWEIEEALTAAGIKWEAE
ncbi:TPA: ead/Ea22-like family protein [Klebsiella pneumoniae]|uniref:ead/Ea22-like family protein n=1 Tax=Klebsiella pneumoniae TaxID=573 RepID=UPI000E2D158B|nr:ead/Ea22-like family protein [Klebsiella pneumoniae]SXJ76965.1 Ead domain protein [Klebsiella pneumoniae]